jgi:hypothetical protein
MVEVGSQRSDIRKTVITAKFLVLSARDPFEVAGFRAKDAEDAKWKC